MTEPLRCAIVGLDSAFWPAGFWQAATDHPETELVAACGLGLSAEEIEKDFYVPVDPWLADHGLTRTVTFDELMEVDFDIAFLSSRNTVMPGLAERLVDAGKHLFVAKPMAITGTDARRYLRAKDAGVVVSAGQLASAWQPWPTMLRLLGEGRIGRLLTMRAVHQHGDYNAFPEQLWYADPTEGDAFNWLGWYPVEAITAAMGPIERVMGVGRQLASSYGEMPDHLAGIFELADGRHATGVAYFTIGAWSMPMHEGELVGTKGVLRFSGPGESVQVLDDNGASTVPFDDIADQLTLEFARFVDAVRGRGEAAASLERAVHVAEVAAAWQESARKGQPVEIDPHEVRGSASRSRLGTGPARS
ncbi:MAG TPA: Gfo/Idh/MocA family oxidoreductase [Acidimicrobiales bacterium]|nr:Gfo/Idh/MocA family oxidoreductase [Acidimicrobiales bacterium]